MTGALIGLLTSALVVWFSYSAFPGIAEYSTDLGIRLRMALDRLDNSSLTMAPGKEGLGFVFLDVDPDPSELPNPGQNACQAVAEVKAGSDTLRDGCAIKQPLDCSSAQPVNRYLLAQLVHGLRSRNARQIILDVTLSAEADVLQPEGAGCLKRELSTVASSPHGIPPVIYAAPVEVVWQEGESGGVSTVKAEDSDYPGAIKAEEPQSAPPPRAVAAIAFPGAGALVRTYPKCFEVDGMGFSRLTLPFRSASLLRKDTNNAGFSCASQDVEAPRIIYTLPHLRGYEDGNVDHTEWAYYRKVYDRCLASKFWDDTSPCSSADTYQGKVVIVGASNPSRRDWHYTPIGNLVGAEVVINAIRSAVEHPKLPQESAGSALLHEWQVLACCSVVWFGFYAIKFRILRNWPRPASTRQRLARGSLSVLLFSFFLVGTVMLAIFLSIRDKEIAPSVSVLIPVLAISVEQYADAMHRIHEWIRDRLGSLMGIHE
jgi:hypothetical protein